MRCSPLILNTIACVEFAILISLRTLYFLLHAVVRVASTIEVMERLI